MVYIQQKHNPESVWMLSPNQGLQSRVAIPLISTAPYRRNHGGFSCRDVCAMTFGHVLPLFPWRSDKMARTTEKDQGEDGPRVVLLLDIRHNHWGITSLYCCVAQCVCSISYDSVMCHLSRGIRTTRVTTLLIYSIGKKTHATARQGHHSTSYVFLKNAIFLT